LDWQKMSEPTELIKAKNRHVFAKSVLHSLPLNFDWHGKSISTGELNRNNVILSGKSGIVTGEILFGHQEKENYETSETPISFRVDSGDIVFGCL
jgi:hypothetical protein